MPPIKLGTKPAGLRRVNTLHAFAMNFFLLVRERQVHSVLAQIDDGGG